MIEEKTPASEDQFVRRPRTCTRPDCSKQYVGRNTVNCPDCWRKHVRGNGNGTEVADLSGLLQAWFFAEDSS